MVNFTPQKFYPQGKRPLCALYRRMIGPQSRSGHGLCRIYICGHFHLINSFYYWGHKISLNAYIVKKIYLIRKAGFLRKILIVTEFRILVVFRPR
jgi:hypothetical protein